MSGPVTPPLEVTEVDGSPDGRPITKLIVSSGDLTISGRTATIDTSGSTSTPGGSDTEVQYNNAGAFGGDAGFTVETAGGGDTTKVRIGALEIYNDNILVRATNADLSIKSDGTGEIILRSSSEAGGTFTDSIVNILSNSNTDDAQLKFRDSANVDNGSITLDGSGHMILNNNVAAKDIDLKVLTTGQVEIANQTTDTESVLSIMGNGTGDAKIDLQNASERVWVLMDENKKLKIKGGSGGNTFVFDASSATGGITFPDTTTLVSAEGTAILATGVTDGYVLTADGADAAAWEAAGGGGATTLSGLTDVLIDATNFTDGLLIQPNSDGSAPTTGTLSTASSNIGIGASTFSLLTTGDQNVAIGNTAGRDMTTSAYQVAIGPDAMQAVTGGYNSVAIGREALKGGASTQAYDDVAVGAGALGNGDYASTGGNVGIGRLACGNTTTGVRNVGVGQNAGQQKAGSHNIGIGFRAGYGYEDQDNCIAIGRHSLYNCEGAGNIAIAYYSGDNITTGANNVVIGTADVATADGDDQLSISNGADGTVAWIVGDSAGSCYQGDNASTWSTTSDRILKREIVDSVTGLDAINAVRVRNFRYIEKAEPIMETQIDEGEEHESIVGYDGENRYNLDPEPLRVGVIAQEVQDVFPDAVIENAHGHLTVNTDSINWALLRAVQELSAKVEALEAA